MLPENVRERVVKEQNELRDKPIDLKSVGV